ncbi:MAG: hypothetical protein OEW08_12605, partial [Gammaproteobacteria bacterium]|nr:hypothetical protein [Gammaproteobacteria bacterium]
MYTITIYSRFALCALLFALAGCPKSNPGTQAPPSDATITQPDPQNLPINTLWFAKGSEVITGPLNKDVNGAKATLYSPEDTSQQSIDTKISIVPQTRIEFSVPNGAEAPDIFGLVMNNSALNGAQISANNARIFAAIAHGGVTTRYVAGLGAWPGESLKITFVAPPESGKAVLGQFEADLCEEIAAANKQCKEPWALHLSLKGSFNMAATDATPVGIATPQAYPLVDEGHGATLKGYVSLGRSPIKNASHTLDQGTSYYQFTGKKNIKYRIGITPLTGDGLPSLAVPLDIKVFVRDEQTPDVLVPATTSMFETPFCELPYVCTVQSDVQGFSFPAALQNDMDYFIQVKKADPNITTPLRLGIAVMDMTDYATSLASNQINIFASSTTLRTIAGTGLAKKTNYYRYKKLDVTPGAHYRVTVNDVSNFQAQLRVFDSAIPKNTANEGQPLSNTQLLCAAVGGADATQPFGCDIHAVSSQIEFVVLSGHFDDGLYYKLSIEKLVDGSASNAMDNQGSPGQPIALADAPTSLDTLVGANESYFSMRTQVGQTYRIDVQNPRGRDTKGVGIGMAVYTAVNGYDELTRCESAAAPGN